MIDQNQPEREFKEISINMIHVILPLDGDSYVQSVHIFLLWQCEPRVVDGVRSVFCRSMLDNMNSQNIDILTFHQLQLFRIRNRLPHFIKVFEFFVTIAVLQCSNYTFSTIFISGLRVVRGIWKLVIRLSMTNKGNVYIMIGDVLNNE